MNEGNNKMIENTTHLTIQQSDNSSSAFSRIVLIVLELCSLTCKFRIRSFQTLKTYLLFGGEEGTGQGWRYKGGVWGHSGRGRGGHGEALSID